MKTTKPYCGFEQGPIRPPSEAESLLLRITRNCPWNQCTFCSLYKGKKFNLRPVEHVLRDIDAVRFYTETIIAARDAGQPLAQSELRQLAPQGETADSTALHAALGFVANGMRSIFIQDGNSLIMKAEDIIQILLHLKDAFPKVERITSYARSQTIAKISDDNLRRMGEAGLNRIHIGMESGSDKVLKMVKKGADKATHILAGQKVKKAGIQLSEYVMPGLGGKRLSRENAEETADALNQIDPDFIRIRTLAMASGAPLTEQYRNDHFDKMGDVDTAEELLIWLEHLEGVNSTIRSDHVLNLFSEIDGTLPEEKEKMLRPLRHFLSLPPYEQMLFCIGRRTHRMVDLAGLDNPVQRSNTIEICERLGAGVDNYYDVIDALMQRFI